MIDNQEPTIESPSQSTTPVIKRYKKLKSAMSVYQRYENHQSDLTDLQREDLHFKLKTGADIVIEENGIHITNPFKLSVQDIAKWSMSQDDNYEIILSNYQQFYDAIKTKYDNEITPTYKPYFASDGYADDSNMMTSPDEIVKFCNDRVNHLRENDDSFEAWVEIEHRRKNIFDIEWHKSNKNLENLKIKMSSDLVLTNTITVLQSVYEEEHKKDLKPGERYTPYSHKQRQYSIGELIGLLQDPSINTNDKTSRPLVLANSSGKRLIGDAPYEFWSGMQIFDIDLKFSTAFNELYENASECRDILFNKLKHYPWLLGVTLSSSGRALHVYTKVSRMHNLFVETDANIKNQKYWYRMSYIQKHAAISYILEKHCGIYDVYSNKKVIDSALAKISQGIAINYDPEAKWSTNYIDLYPALLYHLPPEQGIALEDWLLKPELINKYKAWFYDNAVSDEENVEVTQSAGKMQLIVDETVELDGVKAIDMDSLEKGDKYSTRWRVCNTIMYSYGDTELARSLCHHILQSEKTNTSGTINSFIRSAVINQKEADIYTIRQLKTLGVRIGIHEESKAEIADDSTSKIKYLLESTSYGFRQVEPNVNVRLFDNEYLGMRMDTMLSSLRDFKVNVVESAPNTGKTEFFKSLAKTKSVCLVIPFTSTIESKIVSDDSINALFDVYYGDKKVSEIKKGRSVVMTFDKFASLPKSKYNLFDYIAIDESHLLFTSTYRLSVVSQTIENIRTWILDDQSETINSLNQVMSIQSLMGFVKEPTIVKNQTKVIMMTGTLTGELDYFKFYGLLNYVKVHKQHPFDKKATIHLTQSPEQRDGLIFKTIANAIKSGKKIIHPTNKGDQYSKKVIACVEYLLGRPLKYEYYKRANYDEEFVDDINKDTTVSDIELLFCSDYLSVGVDIKDSSEFELVFGNDFTAESIEQFNNRLRSTNIHCNVIFDILDHDGMQKANIVNTNQIEYVHNDELANMIADERSIAHLQKAITVRSQYFAILGELFSKYFIQDYGGNIKYIRSAFEIEQFELQYNIIARSLLYIKTSLQKKYSYDVTIVIAKDIDENTINHFEELQTTAHREHEIIKSKSFIEVVQFLSSTKVYNIMQKDDFIWIKDKSELENGDTGLHLGYDSNYLGGSWVITWNTQHKWSLDRAKKFTKLMRRLYQPHTIDEILQSCMKTNEIINRTEIQRYSGLMKILFDDRKGSLSESTREILEIAYDYVDPLITKVKLDRFDYESMKSEIRTKIHDNFVEITEQALVSKRRNDNTDVLVSKFIDTLFKKRISKDTVSLSFRKIHTFDSEKINESIHRDKIFRQILLGDTSDVNPNSTLHLSEVHIEPSILVLSS